MFIEQGYKVAIAEQMEDPKEARVVNVKSLVITRYSGGFDQAR